MNRRKLMRKPQERKDKNKKKQHRFVVAKV